SKLSDSRTVSGHKPRRGATISLQKSWADANGIQLGDRVPLATPAGVKRLRVVGLFQFTSGLDFGGQGFGIMPVVPARRLMDKPRVYDEVDLAVGGGEPQIAQVRRRLDHDLPNGIKVETPQNKASDVESELKA